MYQDCDCTSPRDSYDSFGLYPFQHRLYSFGEGLVTDHVRNTNILVCLRTIRIALTLTLKGVKNDNGLNISLYFAKISVNSDTRLVDM